MQIWQKFTTDEPAAETLYRDASDRKERLSALQKEVFIY